MDESVPRLLPLLIVLALGAQSAQTLLCQWDCAVPPAAATREPAVASHGCHDTASAPASASVSTRDACHTLALAAPTPFVKLGTSEWVFPSIVDVGVPLRTARLLPLAARAATLPAPAPNLLARRI